MFRLITAIALVLMPIISVVTSETTEGRIESRDLIDELGVRCPGSGCDPLAAPIKFDDE